MSIALLCVSLSVIVSAAIHAWLLVHNWRERRRWRVLNDLWFEICLSAWQMRDSPWLITAPGEELGVLRRVRKT